MTTFTNINNLNNPSFSLHQIRDLSDENLDSEKEQTLLLKECPGTPGLKLLHCNPLFPQQTIDLVEDILTQWLPEKNTIQNMESGTSNSLLLTSGNSPVALFKPENRELGTQWDNAMHSFKHICSKQGIQPGDGAFREYIASLYIHEFFKLSKIPSNQIDSVETAYVTCASKGLYTPFKTQLEEDRFSVIEQGSLHAFKPCCMTHKQVPDLFENIPTHLAHLLAILDVALMNSDRNAENLLIQIEDNSPVRLILIDHSAILPAKGESSGKFVWLDWPQLQEAMEPETRAFIKQLNPEMFIDILKALKEKKLEKAETFSTESVLVHTLAIQLLQKGVDTGLSLYEIAILFKEVKTLFSDEKSNAIAFLFETIESRGNAEKAVDTFLETYKATLDKLKLTCPDASLKKICEGAKAICIGVYLEEEVLKELRPLYEEFLDKLCL